MQIKKFDCHGQIEHLRNQIDALHEAQLFLVDVILIIGADYETMLQKHITYKNP